MTMKTTTKQNLYKVSFSDLDTLQQFEAFREYRANTPYFCSFKEFNECVVNQMDWDSRTGQEWN